MQADIERLLNINKNLTEGEAKLAEIGRCLGEEERKVKNNTEILLQKNQEISESIEALRKEPDINVDEVVVGKGAVNNQLSLLLCSGQNLQRPGVDIRCHCRSLLKRLFELVSEDHAIDDAIYCLSNALNSEKIQLQIFMKVRVQTRVA
ncbi:hypothetical protein HK104_001174 [Borealophlyctis nickersoniae]|nr:hypothetical protein HK104_001174 [Borealophlyctis nickersoniae]